MTSAEIANATKKVNINWPNLSTGAGQCYREKQALSLWQFFERFNAVGDQYEKSTTAISTDDLGAANPKWEPFRWPTSEMIKLDDIIGFPRVHFSKSERIPTLVTFPLCPGTSEAAYQTIGFLSWNWPWPSFSDRQSRDGHFWTACHGYGCWGLILLYPSVKSVCTVDRLVRPRKGWVIQRWCTSCLQVIQKSSNAGCITSKSWSGK